MPSCDGGQVGSEWWGIGQMLVYDGKLQITEEMTVPIPSITLHDHPSYKIFGHSTRYLPVKYMTYMKLLIRHFRSTHFIILEETLDAGSFSLLVSLPPPPLPRVPLLHPSTASPVASWPSPPRPLRSFRI